MLRALRESGGGAIAVSDAELTEAARTASGTEGIDVSPEGGAAFAAAGQLRQNGTLGPDSRIVIFNTGAGWLYRA
jgi:threonine synthase